ncbi:MAG TPA: flippase-like domain-containing protein [Xanthobacteraceae bacterium]|jgi:putative membrane protein
MLRHVGLIAFLIGTAAAIGLVDWSGIDSVAQAVASVGWGILVVVMIRAVTVSLAGVGWWLIFPAKVRPAFVTCILLRFIREGGNVLLTQVGGDLIGARLLAVRDCPGPLAAASITVDVLLQAATQLLFAAIGIGLLLVMGTSPAVAEAAAIGLAIAAILLIGFYVAQRDTGRRIVRWTISGLIGDRKWPLVGTVDAIYEALGSLYAQRSNLIASTLTHLIGWVVGVAEVLVVFAFMGVPVGLGEAFVIESLLQAIRGAAFAIPSALGAQEGGLILLCAIFGIPPGEAIALSLVKRAADLVVGGPSLLGWQMLEWRELMPQFSADRQHHRGSTDGGGRP